MESEREEIAHYKVLEEREDEEEFANYYFSDKWSAAIESHGYTQIPNLLLLNYTGLDLKPQELLLLINIESYRWYENKLPYPSIKTLASRMGVTTRNVTRIGTSLEKKGVLERIRRTGTSNLYSFAPLVSKLNDIANYVGTGGQSGSVKHDNNIPIIVTKTSPKEDSPKDTNLKNTNLNNKPKEME